ncbi:MAG TPA: GNAT family protein [Pseudogracilibacillus sp.]|nr:GNAT family protein [Pseudogracilibacillus sp.]
MFTYKIDDEVSLRMLTERDAEEFYLLTMASKEHLKQWLGWLDQIRTIEDTLRHINGSLQTFVALGGLPSSFAIIYKGQIAGTIGFNKVSELHRIGSIGYWIGEAYEGKGIMSRAFSEMLSYGFESLHLNRIEVYAATENKRSRALPEKFGFTHEGILRQAEWLYDRFVDHAIYGLLKEEWEK